MISAPLRSDAFVGRGEELVFLRARAREAIDGGSCTVVLTGEAGIGKTRLLDEFLSRQQGELHVVRVRCSTTVREAAAVLHELCDGFAALLHREPPEPMDAGRALSYLRSAIRTARSAGAIIITIEDAHHAVSEAIDALEQLAGSERTLLLLTVVASDAADDVDESFDRLRRRDAYELRLAPLPAEAMRRMIRRFQTAPATLSRSLVSRVIEFAHGNPSLAQDLIRAAAENAGASEISVPRSLRTRVRRMLAILDPRAQKLLLIAAALGTRFEIRVLAHVAQERVGVVREGVQSAAMVDLVRETEAQRFAFADPLYRMALQAETTASFAAGYHRRAALYLQRSAIDTSGYAAVAEQWRGAGEFECACAWDERAGDAAAERDEFVVAAAAYRRAQLDCRAEKRLRSLLFKRASALGRAGMEREAVEAFDEYLAGGVDDDRETWADALLQKSTLLWDAGNFGEIEALANDVLALELPGDTFRKARALVELASLRWTTGRLDETRALLERVEREHDVHDPETLAMFHQQRALVIHARSGFEAAVPDFRRGVEHMRHSRNAPEYAQSLCNLGNIALLHAHNDLALEMLARACEVARTGASESRLHFALGSYARALMRVGRNGEAHAVLNELGNIDADLAELHALYSVAAMLELGSIFGDSALSERALDSDTLALAFQSGDPIRILALAGPFALYRWHAGEEEAASTLLHDALLVVEGATWHYPFAVLIAQFGVLSDVPRARRMLKPPMVVGEPRVIEAFVDLFDAFIARRRGRNRTAALTGRRAASRFAAIGWPYYEAQAREVAGDHAEALQLYDRIGDTRDAQKLRAALRPSRRSGRHAVALTPREREVGLLALDGLSNARIATHLGIGERTVEHHLQVVYGKFGIRSRWQLPNDL
jgi:DNA-binding CsgD family transcriptional regulator